MFKRFPPNCRRWLYFIVMSAATILEGLTNVKQKRDEGGNDMGKKNMAKIEFAGR